MGGVFLQGCLILPHPCSPSLCFLAADAADAEDASVNSYRRLLRPVLLCHGGLYPLKMSQKGKPS